MTKEELEKVERLGKKVLADFPRVWMGLFNEVMEDGKTEEYVFGGKEDKDDERRTTKSRI